jgi:uncharacterized protein (TIGR02757 family)
MSIMGLGVFWAMSFNRVPNPPASITACIGAKIAEPINCEALNWLFCCMKDWQQLKEFLDEKVEQYNQPGFIQDDPIQIPHQFKKLQDIEIAGFFAATLAWGQRKTIITKCKELMHLMDNSPHDFMLNHSDKDLKRLTTFKHRTFNTTDLLYFVHFFEWYYRKEKSLEKAFIGNNMHERLKNFHRTFFALPDFPTRTKKHIATPERKSACKRLNMFLRWMVRHDDQGVDLGLWKNILSAELICPIDLHVERVARKLKLIKRKSVDWQTAEELTQTLSKFDPTDPVKYDFALFGLGLEGFTRPISKGRSAKP